ncbi:MAG: DUF488 family protein [Chloroflexota bacterium]
MDFSVMEKGNPITNYMIGHSNLAIGTILKLLQQYHIQVVFDVRNLPYSKYAHPFNRDTFEFTLELDQLSMETV